jgi:AraC-like DNA-binding protein
VGNTPKQFIKIVRFHEVMTNLTTVKPGKLTQHAHENGYFDQAHFIRDFKAYSGYTPKELLSQKYCNGLSQDTGQI